MDCDCGRGVLSAGRHNDSGWTEQLGRQSRSPLSALFIQPIKLNKCHSIECSVHECVGLDLVVPHPHNVKAQIGTHTAW